IGEVIFSSSGRHTIFSRDWSSDVCSSDLLDALDLAAGAKAAPAAPAPEEPEPELTFHAALTTPKNPELAAAIAAADAELAALERSEERRGGKEWTARRQPSREHEERGDRR